jgi:hypothetical protein
MIASFLVHITVDEMFYELKRLACMQLKIDTQQMNSVYLCSIKVLIISEHSMLSSELLLPSEQ